ncbi:hypothetical protein BJ138DRAFT_1183679 [Hygrophoropsis aurantiaca]|uniref:Uncharacterized protein n=1 Tax=Hygrophoropsis aurantiaca TaxID=72124 RepID=A0ACB7ZWG2_9AGAM|nr:hypothetical protein BJ138DRAFT_1183679 [Hygrophoropsis aurantiaca]
MAQEASKQLVFNATPEKTHEIGLTRLTRTSVTFNWVLPFDRDIDERFTAGAGDSDKASFTAYGRPGACYAYDVDPITHSFKKPRVFVYSDSGIPDGIQLATGMSTRAAARAHTTTGEMMSTKAGLMILDEETVPSGRYDHKWSHLGLFAEERLPIQGPCLMIVERIYPYAQELEFGFVYGDSGAYEWNPPNRSNMTWKLYIEFQSKRLWAELTWTIQPTEQKQRGLPWVSWCIEDGDVQSPTRQLHPYDLAIPPLQVNTRL